MRYCFALLFVVGFACTAVADLPDAPDTLPGTQPLDWPEQEQVEVGHRLMDSAHRFVEGQIELARERRTRHWDRDTSSTEAYERSIQPNRERFAFIIGVTDEREPVAMERFGDARSPALVAEHADYRVYQVRWKVLHGVWGEGLLVEPRGTAAGHAVVVPDADQTPEQVMGLAGGLDDASQTARRLAEEGFAVVVPQTINRQSVDPSTLDIAAGRGGGLRQQTHREWIYRQAFHMGRHVIGYEVQTVRAAVDWLTQQGAERVGVAGHGEGGLVAFYAAAVDPAIDAALVSGYFDSREQTWQEPVYRNVWGLVDQFGDAELATLIAPRGLVVEYSDYPEVSGHKGDLEQPPFARVAAEFERIDALIGSGLGSRMLIHGPDGAPVGPGSTEALAAFATMLGADDLDFAATAAPVRPLVDRRARFDPAQRHLRQVHQMQEHVQRLVRRADYVREQFFLGRAMPELLARDWSAVPDQPTLDPEPFIEGAKWHRDYFRNELIGQFDETLLPPNARTRKTYHTEHWAGYEVVLDVFDELFTWGVLLVPHDIEPGERRPVVVAQHGRHRLPEIVIDAGLPAYSNFAAQLAERGFVVFAPHNLFWGEEPFRWLDRKANTLGRSLYSILIHQHDQLLQWMQSLDFVDGERIALYGLSFGGQTAQRIPAALEDYSVAITSGIFNQWTRKIASTESGPSFVYSIEWEAPHFNMGHTFDHAEMAYLVFPRPYMVERGHHDRVGYDHWVGYEYAKVRRLYALLGMPERTTIQYFHGGHAIRGDQTFDFLHKHLNWPAP